MTATIAVLDEHIDRRVTAASITYFEDVIGDVEVLRTVTPIAGNDPDVVYGAYCPNCDTFPTEAVSQHEAEQAAATHHAEGCK